MLGSISRYYQAILLCFYILLCLILAYRLSYYPSQVERADAWGYINHALELRADGLLGKLSSWRTYGYIWFIYFCSLIFGTERGILAFGTGLVQAVLYAAAAFWLAMTASPRKEWRLAILIGLLLNPILVALVIDTLTESMALILAVLLVTIVFKATRADDAKGTFGWLAVGSALAAFSLMVRPANLPLLVAWNAAVLPILWRDKLANGAIRTGLYCMMFLGIAAVVWLPQLIITARHFGGASIFPASSLGNFQMLFGIKLLKYATRVEGSLAAGLFYPNPWLTSLASEDQLWRWYLENPVAGILTAASHVFNALNYDYLFVYVYDHSLPYSIAISFAVWFVYVHGIAGTWISARQSLGLKSWRNAAPVVAFMLVAAALTFATIAISAVESRFSTLIVAALSTFAAYFVLSLKPRFSDRVYVFGAAVLVSSAAVLTSEWMKSLTTIVPPS